MNVKSTDEQAKRFFMPVPFFSSDELSYRVEPAFQHMLGPKTLPLSEIDNPNVILTNKKKVSKVIYELNNDCHRSESFKPIESDKTNVLFAGCSVTFGEYLPEGYAWPSHVYNYMKTNVPNLGDFNVLAYPGGTGPKIISNIFKYVRNYGRPDYIMILLPDMFRYYAPHEDGSGFAPKITYATGLDIVANMTPFRGLYDFQNNYRMLESFCELLGIKLFGTSWDTLANQKMLDLKFKTYQDLPKENLIEQAKHLDLEDYSYYDDSFMISAADDLHPGLVTQLAYAGHFVERLKDDIKN